MIDIITEGRYMDTKYQVMGVERYDLGDVDILDNTETNDPKKAIKIWCIAAAKSHGGASIIAEDKDAACELIDWAYDHKDMVMNFMDSANRFPYKKDYIMDAIDKQHEKRCPYFSSKYPDQVFPFSEG